MRAWMPSRGSRFNVPSISPAVLPVHCPQGAAVATASVTITETQTNNRFDALTGARRNGFKAYPRTDQVVVTSEVVAAVGCSLRQNSEKVLNREGLHNETLASVDDSVARICTGEPDRSAGAGPGYRHY